MKFTRVLSVLMLALFALMLAVVPAAAQDDAVTVRILPIDNAQFLPGSMFDFRVEVEAAALPENFSVTINGTPAAELYGEATNDTWEYGGKVASVVNEGTPGADFSIDSLAGEYYNAAFGVAAVTVVDGKLSIDVAGSTVTGDPVADNVLAFNVIGGAADGQVATFGLNADGAVTGFSVAGQNFGVLTTLPTKVVAPTWRDLAAPAAGDYVVEVTAGATTQSVTWTVREAQAGTAKNVILFIADGMSVGAISAARAASKGITQGKPHDRFAMEKLGVIGLASTSSVDAIMADSANTASALNTGHVGSVNATGTYSDTSPDRLDDPKVETFASMIKRTRGMAVGVVTTADFSDATPAAVWAHGRDRSDNNRAAYMIQAFDFGLDVLMGGGGQRMLPQSTEGSRRPDERDLFAEFTEAGYTIVVNKTELDGALTADGLPAKLIGVFHPRDMSTWLDRNVYTDNLGDFTDQPGLVDMTIASLNILNQNPNGFYLEVEAASVDKQFHPLDAERGLSDLIEFDKAIEAAVAWAQENAPDTLIVVTADHGHGYDVFGTVDVAKFNAATDDNGRRAAIGLYNGGLYPTYTDEDGDGFPNWEADRTFAHGMNNFPTHTENYQVSPSPRSPATTTDGVIVDNPDDDQNGITITGNINSTSGVHTLQDVPVFAGGPGAEFFQGTYHQSEIFFGMAAAIGLNPAAEDGMTESAALPVTTAGVNFPAGISTVLLVGFGLAAGLFLGRRQK